MLHSATYFDMESALTTEDFRFVSKVTKGILSEREKERERHGWDWESEESY